MRRGSRSALVLAAAVAGLFAGCGRLLFGASGGSVDAGAAGTDSGDGVRDASVMDAPAMDAGAISMDAGSPVDALAGETGGGGFVDADIVTVDAGGGGPTDASTAPGCDPAPRHYPWAPGGGSGVGLAWSGSTFLLAFNDGADTLHTRILDATGVELTTETLVSPTAEASAGPPAVVWNGTSFLVVWISSVDRSVRGRFIGADGVFDPRPERTLSTTAGPYSRPSIAATDSGYFVGVMYDVAGSSPAYIELDGSLAPLAERQIAAGPSGMYPNEGCPVGVSGGEVAAASVDTIGTPQLSVSTRRLDGTFLSSMALAARGAPNNTRLGIACRPPNDCAVSWGDAMSNTHLVAFRTPLTVASDYVIAVAPAGGTDIATDGTRYVVVWNDAFAQTVHYAVMTGATPDALAVTTPSTMVSAPGRRAIWPAITWAGENTFAVAWRDETDPGQSFARVCL